MGDAVVVVVVVAVAVTVAVAVAVVVVALVGGCYIQDRDVIKIGPFLPSRRQQMTGGIKLCRTDSS